MKPLIGLNLDVVAGSPSQVRLNQTYYAAVQKAGGIPFLITPMCDADVREVLDKISGLILIGGKDYHPEIYGERATCAVETSDKVRQEFDLRLARMIIEQTDLPILGICAGHQIINISQGGTLVQDIKTEHAQSVSIHGDLVEGQTSMHRHSIEILKGTELHKIYGKTTFEVASSHHQAIKKLGRGLEVSAIAPDGIIEAIEFASRPFTIGVQFHPERDGDSTLFEALIGQARLTKHHRTQVYDLPAHSYVPAK